MKSLLIKTSIVLFFTSSAFAQIGIGSGGGFSVRGNKDSVRWTLSDWMQQKQQFRMQDQWLALNKQANEFEFGMNASAQKYDSENNGVTTSETATQYNVSLWYKIFGLEYSLLDSSEDFTRTSYQFNVRLFGQSASSTSLTAFYGQQETEYDLTGLDYKGEFAGGDLKLYIFDFFGLTGNYRSDFEAEDSNNTKYEGYRAAYGAFIEVFVFRIGAEFFRESVDVTPSSGSPRTDKRDGLQTSIQIYL